MRVTEQGLETLNAKIAQMSQHSACYVAGIFPGTFLNASTFIQFIQIYRIDSFSYSWESCPNSGKRIDYTNFVISRRIEVC